MIILISYHKYNELKVLLKNFALNAKNVPELIITVSTHALLNFGLDWIVLVSLWSMFWKCVLLVSSMVLILDGNLEKEQTLLFDLCKASDKVESRHKSDFFLR